MSIEVARFDLVCIGNAIVDVLAQVPAGMPEAHGMIPGSMALIDGIHADALYATLRPEQQTGGGSAANTAVTAAKLGLRTAYLGTVADDRLGTEFAGDLAGAGIHYPTARLDQARAGGHGTARCMILVTPDGQRTMNTYLGACTAFGPDDLDEAVIADAQITYLEGYLFDPPAAQLAFRRAVEVAHRAGRLVALSLSDAFCVHRHRRAFLELVAGGVDILFANADEIMALFETPDFDAAARLAGDAVKLAVLTRGAEGSVVIEAGTRTGIAAAPVTVRDSTGAGDAYAAGFLAGLANGRPVAVCGQLGAIAAAEVISHLGARPQSDLAAAKVLLQG